MGVPENYIISIMLPSMQASSLLTYCLAFASVQCTEVRLLSGGLTTMAVINPPERKMAKYTSVQCGLICVELEGAEWDVRIDK